MKIAKILFVAALVAAGSIAGAQSRPLVPGGSFWYVNSATGNDANTCRTVALPCRTIAHAVNLVQAVDTAGATIKLADGFYDLSGPGQQIVAMRPFIGDCQFFIEGNNASPGNVVLSVGSGQAAVAARDFGIVTISGVKPVSTGTGSTALMASQFGVIDYHHIEFGQFTGGVHVSIGGAGSVNSLDTSTGTSITGSASNHISIVGAGGNYSMGGATIAVSPGLTFYVFVRVYGPSMLNWGFNYYTGNVTGAQVDLSGGAMFYKGGTVIPGTSPGSISNNALSL